MKITIHKFSAEFLSNELPHFLLQMTTYLRIFKPYNLH